jgi:hypothetical protein
MPDALQNIVVERGAETQSSREDVGARIWGAIKDALRSATHLQVVTILGEASIVADASVGFDKLTATLPAAGAGDLHALVTNIDLAFGDVSQSLSPKLVDGSQEALVKAHADMLARSQAIVQDNLRMLKELAKELATDFTGRT